MKVSELQCLMDTNRKAIRHLEDCASMHKYYRKIYADLGHTVEEYSCHNRLQQVKKKIAKLVSLQKSLKREVREKVEMESERARLNRYYSSLHAHFGML